jgi:N-acetylneuraminate synthase
MQDLEKAQAELAELEKTYELTKSNLFSSVNCPFEIMHCNSTYPMPEDDANLLCIPMLKSRYKCDVGYSGHESSLLKTIN